jgi:hypothetical protein
MAWEHYIELDESKRSALDQMAKSQEKIKETFNHGARQRNFKEGYHVLMWDKRKEKPGMYKKFDSLWIGPYRIESEVGTNSFILATPKGEKIPVNGYLLKPYFPERIWLLDCSLD